MLKQTKWIIVSGGVLSGLGKGIVTASIGRLLSSDLKVIPVKCDGYLNVDPGTMNPIEHGEVFVLDDGGEVDMDFGHYERFLNIDCKFDWNLTSGKVYQNIVEKERKGLFLGKTVQMVPHISNEIKTKWKELAKKEQADVMIIELGGTVGDIEMDLFFEASRQLKLEVDKENLLFCHLTYVPILHCVGEQKTKPTQQSVDLMQARGIQPDIIIGRSPNKLTKRSKEKIALFCNIKEEEVISDPDLPTVYELPLIFKEEGLLDLIEKKLELPKSRDLVKWEKLVNNIKEPEKEVTIAMCGKYTELKDSYISISEALIHCGATLKTKIKTRWIETTDIEQEKTTLIEALKDIQGIIVPGGFGSRGTEGKIKVIEHARINNIPFLGLCLGLQLAVIEFARNVCNLEANSTEINKKTKAPVIDFLPEQKNIHKKGGTMRLGAYEAILKKDSITAKLYNSLRVYERHRHRYEVNPKYHNILTKNGLSLSGTSPDNTLVEFIELPKHKYFVATQAHPELKSRLERPAPLFLGFVKAMIK